jgi:hypothetical protein
MSDRTRNLGYAIAVVFSLVGLSIPARGDLIEVNATGTFDHLIGVDALGVDGATFDLKFNIDSGASPRIQAPTYALYDVDAILTLDGTCCDDGTFPQAMYYMVETDLISDVLRLGWEIRGLTYQINLELHQGFSFPFPPPLFEPGDITGVRIWGSGPAGTVNEYTLRNVVASAVVVPEPSALTLLALASAALILLHRKIA